MAIHAYTGLPGSGKSYGVFQNVIVPALKKGKVVWTNIPFNEEKVAAHCGSVPTLFKVADIQANENWFQDVLPKGAVIVLDEVWRLWPSGLKTNNVKEPHKSFLAEHRHMVGEDGYSTEIYLVTQDLAQIAAFARQLVDTTVRASKLTSIGQSGRFKIEIYDGAVSGQKPPADKRIRQTFGKYEPEIYLLYQSHTMSESGDAGDETVTDDRKNIFKGAGFKVIVAIAVIIPVFVIMGIYKVREYYANGASDKSKQPVSQNLAPTAQGGTQPPAPKREKDWLEKVKIEIKSNIDDGTGIKYVFSIRDGAESVSLPQSTLYVMGYTLVAYDPCLAMIVKDQIKLYVMCPEQQRTGKSGLNLVDSVSEEAKGVTNSTL